MTRMTSKELRLHVIKPPRGLVLLVDRPIRVRLWWAFFGAIAVALTETVALATLIPLMQLLSGSPPSLGFLVRPGGLLYGWPTRNLAILLCGVIVVAFVTKGVLSIAYRWWVGGFVTNAQIRTSTRLLEYYLAAPYPLHLRRSLGDFNRNLNEAVGQAYGGVVMGAVNVLTEAVTVLAIAVTLFLATPVPAFWMTSYFAVTGTMLYLGVRNHALAAGKRALSASEEVFGNSVQPLQNIKDVKIRDNADVFVRLYEVARKDGAMAYRITSFLADLPKYSLEILFVLGVALVSAGLFWNSSTDTIGTLALIALAGFRVLPSMTRMMASLNGIKASTPGLDIVLVELEESERIKRERAGAITPLPLTRELVIEELGYSYESRDQPVLVDINLRIPAGASVALVGGSGAGKTTLANCLLGLLPPTHGRILVDGVDIQSNLRGWQHDIGMVPQDVIALVASVTDNISFRDPHPDMDRVRMAAERAQLTDFVNELPHGYETKIGHGGAGMSGGQLQRLGLARALYRMPSILVLDEATSALDNATERKITDAIEALQGTMTIVVIAHRLSTIRHCDRIVLMKDGGIDDTGTFDELTLRNPEFAYLVALGNLETRLGNEELELIRSGATTFGSSRKGSG